MTLPGIRSELSSTSTQVEGHSTSLMSLDSYLQKWSRVCLSTLPGCWQEKMRGLIPLITSSCKVPIAKCCSKSSANINTFISCKTTSRGRCCYSPILQMRGVRHRESEWFASQWTELGFEIRQSDWSAHLTTTQHCLSCGNSNILLKWRWKVNVHDTRVLYF